MDFTLTDTQLMMTQSVDRLLDERDGGAAGAAPVDPRTRWHGGIWAGLRELGITALPFDEAVGGHAGTGIDVMLVMQRLGGALATTPFLASVVMAGHAIARGAHARQRETLLPGVAAGTTVAAWAHDEAEARHEPDRVTTVAQRAADGWRLAGLKTHVPCAIGADLLVVSARTGRPDAPVRLFAVDTRSSGLELRGATRIDGVPVARVDFHATPAVMLAGGEDDAMPIVHEVIDRAVAATIGEAVGAMDAALRLTLSHLGTRRQFGATIGSFQALQHRAADMYVAIEQSRSMAMYAAMCADSSDPRTRGAGVSAARLVTDRAARLVADAAIQLHGGLGMTTEYAVGRYVKKLVALRATFGDTDHHARRMAALGGVVEFP